MDPRPFDHPIVVFERWRDQADMALGLSRHPETWMPLDPDELVRIGAEYKGVLTFAEQELPALVYEWENA